MKIHLKARLKAVLNQQRDFHVQRTSSRHAPFNRLINTLDIHSSLLSKDHSFRNSLQGSGYNDLVGEFGKASSSNLTHAYDALAHPFQDRLEILEDGSVSSDHDRERSLNSADLSTADRCIQHGNSL